MVNCLAVAHCLARSGLFLCFCRNEIVDVSVQQRKSIVDLFFYRVELCLINVSFINGSDKLIPNFIERSSADPAMLDIFFVMKPAIPLSNIMSSRSGGSADIIHQAISFICRECFAQHIDRLPQFAAGFPAIEFFKTF